MPCSPRYAESASDRLLNVFIQSCSLYFKFVNLLSAPIVDKSSIMSDAAAPKEKKPRAPKKPAEHPPFKTMIVEAIATLKEVRTD